MFVVVVIFSFGTTGLQGGGRGSFVRYFGGFVGFVLLPGLPPVRCSHLVFVGRGIRAGLFRIFTS